MAWRGRALQQVHPSADSGVQILHPSLGPDCDDPDTGRSSPRRLTERKKKRTPNEHDGSARCMSGGGKRASPSARAELSLPGGDTRIDPADLRERPEYYGRE
jgi:hypothetical protein